AQFEESAAAEETNRDLVVDHARNDRRVGRDVIDNADELAAGIRIHCEACRASGNDMTDVRFVHEGHTFEPRCIDEGDEVRRAERRGDRLPGVRRYARDDAIDWCAYGRMIELQGC